MCEKHTIIEEGEDSSCNGQGGCINESFAIRTSKYSTGILLESDIRRWLHQHGAPSSDITLYKDDVHKLFHCSSYEEYTNELENCNTRWDGEFKKYYLKEIHPHVPEYIGRWVLEDLHIYNPYSGIINQSESLNFVLIARMERS